jgi:nucleoside-diphosphate-sugar epimerase
LEKRILITGHLGYIGSVMAPYLQRRGYKVSGLDTGYFEQCTLIPPLADIQTTREDIRRIRTADLEGFDAVIHLAALSNDPLGNLNPRWTKEINTAATIHLAQAARAAGVRRFLLSSSCIMYGSASLGGAPVSEESPVDPRTGYAQSKVEAETAIRRLAAPGFSPVYLRNGTIYGLSPRMRFDTVLNSLAGSGVSRNRVKVFSDGYPWRPLVHVEDVCAAFHAVLEAPIDAIHDQALNVGADSVNIQIGELARITAEAAGASVEILASEDADQRTYRTSFRKLQERVPAFTLRWTPADGVLRLVGELQKLKLSAAQFESSRFTRLRWLTGLLEQGVLDESLEWTDRFVPNPAQEAALA